MTFDEIYTKVLEDFRRPDKEAQIKTKIKEAIHTAHTADRFQRDAVGFVTPSLTCGGVVGCYTIDVDTSLQNFRDLVSVQIMDESSGTAGVQLPFEDFPTASMDMFAIKRVPAVTQLGNSIQIRLGDTPGYLRKFYVQYLTFPVLTDPVPESWVMRHYPYLIVNKALASLFRSTGNAEQAAAKAQDAREQHLIMIENNLVLGR